MRSLLRAAALVVLAATCCLGAPAPDAATRPAPLSDDALLANLKSPDPKVRGDAAEALAGPVVMRYRGLSYRELSRPVRPGQEDWKAREIKAVKAATDPRLADAMMAALKDSEKRVRIAAISTLDRLAEPRAAAPLVPFLKDADIETRLCATGALGELAQNGIRPASVIDGLVGALDDSNNWVRESAAVALGLIGDPRGVEQLLAMMRSPDADRRQCAAYGLSRLARAGNRDQRVCESLAAAAKDAAPEVRQSAVEGLSLLRDPRALEPLAQMLKDADPHVRGSAAGNLTKWYAASEDPRYGAWEYQFYREVDLDLNATALKDALVRFQQALGYGYVHPCWRALATVRITPATKVTAKVSRESVNVALWQMLLSGGRPGQVGFIAREGVIVISTPADLQVRAKAMTADKAALWTPDDTSLIRKMAEENIELDFEATSLVLFLKYLQEVTTRTLTLAVNFDAINRAAGPQAIVNLKVKRVPLNVVLRLVLDEAAGPGKLGFAARHGAVYLSSAEEIAKLRPDLASPTIAPVPFIPREPFQTPKPDELNRDKVAQDPKVVEASIEAVKDNNSWHRLDAATVLGHSGDPRAMPILLPMLKDAVTNVRAGVARAIGMMLGRGVRDPNAFGALLAMRQDDKEAWVRGTALEALGLSGDPRAVEHLVAALSDKSLVGNRDRALKGLGNLIKAGNRDPRVLNALLAALKDYDMPEKAAEVLGELMKAGNRDPQIEEALLGVIKQPLRGNAFRAAARALGQTNDARFIAPLAEAARNAISEEDEAAVLSALADSLACGMTEEQRAAMHKMNRGVRQIEAKAMPLAQVANLWRKSGPGDIEMNWRWGPLASIGIVSPRPIDLAVPQGDFVHGLVRLLLAADKTGRAAFAVLDKTVVISTREDLRTLVTQPAALARPAPDPVREKLSQKIDLDFERTDLNHFLQYLQETAKGLVIRADWDALKAVGLLPTTPVSFSARRLPLGNALQLVLDVAAGPDKVAVTVKDGAVILLPADARPGAKPAAPAASPAPAARPMPAVPPASPSGRAAAG